MTEPDILPGATSDQPFMGTRSEAAVAGAIFYALSKPCAKGHFPAARYTASGHCAACRKQQYKVWHSDNPEKQPAYMRVWYGKNARTICAKTNQWQAANIQRVRELQRQWAQLNPVRISAAQKRYTQAHPDRIAVKSNRRRSRVSFSVEHYTEAEVKALFIEQNGLCAYCGEKLRPGYHRDHMTPLEKMGSDGIANIALACPRCNWRKGTMTAEEFRAKLEKEKCLTTTAWTPNWPPTSAT